MLELYFIAGTKGGVGKSTVAGLLAETAREQGFDVVLFDCDNENRSLMSSFKCVEGEFELSGLDPDSEEKAFPLDDVINRAAAEMERGEDAGKVFIVDMKAGTSYSAQGWFRSVPLSELSAGGVGINVVGCVTSDVESAYTFAAWIEYFLDAATKGDVRFVVVRNMRDGKDFSYYDENLAKTIRDCKGVELTMPRFEGAYMEQLKLHKTTLGRAARGTVSIPGYDGFMDVSRMRRYYSESVGKFKKLFRGASATGPMEGKRKKQQQGE